MTRLDNGKLLIAETDEAGRLEWLWKKMPHDRTARPLRPEEAGTIQMDAFMISGISRSEAANWLSRYGQMHASDVSDK